MTLDLSDDGPVFSALDEMMMKLVDEARIKHCIYRINRK